MTTDSARELTNHEMQDLLARLGSHPKQAATIYQGRNRQVIRVTASPRATMIVKVWRRSKWRGALRHLLRISAPDYEFRNLRRLARKGIRVPQPYGLCRISGKGKQFTEALFLEDLGETTSATEHIKRLISDGQENIVQAFEDQLIEMTRTMVSAGIVDTDLLLVNIVVPKTGEPVRLDLELARLVFFPRLFWRRYARMIGQLIGSHAFAVQPEVSRTTDFASRLARRMHPPIRVLRHAARHVRAMMADQARDAHIHTRVELPW